METQYDHNHQYQGLWKHYILTFEDTKISLCGNHI